MQCTNKIYFIRTSQEFVLKVLEVLNCVLSGSNQALQKHLVQEDIVKALTALLTADEVAYRQMALAALSTMSTGACKDSVLKSAVLNEVVKVQ
jgi:hypothetical protein